MSDLDSMSAAELAAILGTSARMLRNHRNTLYGWLPIPSVILGPWPKGNGPRRVLAVRWPRAETLAALQRGRQRMPRGWHPVPGCDGAEVWVASIGSRPSRVRFDAFPEGAEPSEWLTDIEVAIHQHFGHLAYLDTPSPCVPGTWPIRPATL